MFLWPIVDAANCLFLMVRILANFQTSTKVRLKLQITNQSNPNPVGTLERESMGFAYRLARQAYNPRTPYLQGEAGHRSLFSGCSKHRWFVCPPSGIWGAGRFPPLDEGCRPAGSQRPLRQDDADLMVLSYGTRIGRRRLAPNLVSGRSLAG